MNNRAMLPWQIDQWHLLWEAKQHNRLPHALLLTGAAGLGKAQFAEHVAAAMLCEHPASKGDACYQCHACQLILAKSHPDFLVIAPEEAGRVIKIDQIRYAVSLSHGTTLQGGYRIIIINPAHAMNQYAANALLKTLEEPIANTLFILISEQNLRLPLTIASRCQKIIFQKPKQQVALNWLRTKSINSEIDLALLLSIAEGAPLKVLALIENNSLNVRQIIYHGLNALIEGKADPLQLAAEWKEYDMTVLFHLLLSWLRDLLRLQSTREVELINFDFQTSLLNVIDTLSPKNLLAYIDFVQERYTMMLNLQNLNSQLLLEELLIYWQRDGRFRTKANLLQEK